ncbi:MAG: biosynthetic arginine decarboxylase [Candidatus Kapabacteria bacterium]|jgi:arginine decarboxylase|nr:biosynthetic arginine decarboxylase [Candidatus Kapabacteria bacterium]
MRNWKIEDSEELYNIKGWGSTYYGINKSGNVCVTPKSSDVSVDLKELVDDLQSRDVALPVLLRFPDILDNRIEMLSQCFENSAKEYDYKGNYYTIYPIKVNQMRPVVEEILTHGRKFNIGLEAGSKPELHAVLAITDNPEALIVCNGYKDAEYLELALRAQKMGKNIFLVVEKLNELKQIINIAKRLKIRPNIGIRVKLSAGGSGKWEESGGDQSKFGLSAGELLEAVDIIEENGLKDCLKLIHFHIGSQVTKIRKIKTALREASQFYVQLNKMGCVIDFVDIGGGLGVDYDGTKSTGPGSMNYSVQEYLNDAVFLFNDVCSKHDLPHPSILSESGRSLTAHHSMLVFNVLETTSLPEWGDNEEIGENNHELMTELYNIYDSLSQANMTEHWHDAVQIREESLDLFGFGMLTLKTRALIERMFWTIAREVNKMSQSMKHIPNELRELNAKLADKYFCNFSLFQSLPDSWAIDQVFPVMPLHRLKEKPTKIATIQDITCDSDGKISKFIGNRDDSKYLSLHTLKKNDPYYLGVFLIGAYQEILGDMHNLFGDTNVVHVGIKSGKYNIEKVIDGETVSEVLGYVQYNAKTLLHKMESQVSAAVKSGVLTSPEAKEFLADYRSGLYGYTYLE